MSDRDVPPARDRPSALREEPAGERVPWLGVAAPNGDAQTAPRGRADGRPDWSPVSAPLALVTAVVTGGIGGAVVALIVGALLGLNATGSNLPPGLEITATAVQDATFVAVAVLFARLGGRRARPEQFGLRTTGFWAPLAMIVILYVAFFVVTVAWQGAFGDHTPEKLLNQLGANLNAGLLIASALLTCVVAPFCEEFLFRGYIFTALRNWRGPWPAAVLTGLVFGGVHVLSAPVVDLLPLAFLGFGLCLLYWRTRSLLPGIATHSINNSIAFAALEHWPARDYVLLAAAALGILALIVGAMRSAGLVVDAAPAPPLPA